MPGRSNPLLADPVREGDLSPEDQAELDRRGREARAGTSGALPADQALAAAKRLSDRIGSLLSESDERPAPQTVKSYRIEIAERAMREIALENASYNAHRRTGPADLVLRQFERAISALEYQAATGTRVRSRQGDARRFLVKRIRYHLYYFLCEDDARVEVVMIRHAVRRPVRRIERHH